MLLNRTYRCVYTSPSRNGNMAESFRVHIAGPRDWQCFMDRLKSKQISYPERNYRIQIFDPNSFEPDGWDNYPLTPNRSHNLFS